MKTDQERKTAIKIAVRQPVTQFSKRVAALALVGMMLAACSSAPAPKSKPKPRSKEYFAESKYGVKASPRVAYGKGKLPRGGGRSQVGKPYKVRGKWYHPKEEPGYKKVGRASWYGDAFHGRLTANGEVYDTQHLTAAHPTMPLPSYARVTNVANGSSVIVRVNDRGPYSNNRVIDLSQRAAEMLDYTHHGTADVKVEYVGRAPLDGNDDAFLMASYQNGSDPIGQPATGVMMAMNGPTPTSRNVPTPTMFGGQPAPAGFQSDDVQTQLSSLQYIPVPADKPTFGFGVANAGRIGGLAGYANDRIAKAQAFESSTYGSVLAANAMSDAWRRSMSKQGSSQKPEGEYVDIGFFESRVEADRIAQALIKLGTVTHIEVPTENGWLHGLTGTASLGKSDELLLAAWQAGADDAFVVRAD